MKKKLVLDGISIEYNPKKLEKDQVSFDFEGEEYTYKVHHLGGGLTLKRNGEVYRITCVQQGLKSFISWETQTYILDEETNIIGVSESSKEQDDGLALSPMPGKILKILVSVGDCVDKGESLIVMEAMKMEHTIKASRPGAVSTICCKKGLFVEEGTVLVELDLAKVKKVE